MKELSPYTYLDLALVGRIWLQETWFPAASWLPKSTWPSLIKARIFCLIVKVPMWNPSSIPVPWLAFTKRILRIPLGYHELQNRWLNLDFNLFQHFFLFSCGLVLTLWASFYSPGRKFTARVLLWTLSGNDLPCPLITGHKLVLSFPAAVNLPHACPEKCHSSPWGWLSLQLGDWEQPWGSVDSASAFLSLWGFQFQHHINGIFKLWLVTQRSFLCLLGWLFMRIYCFWRESIFSHGLKACFT